MQYAYETVEQRQEAREKIAAELNARYDAAKAMFPDGIAFGSWVLRDNTGVEPDRRVYCCRRQGDAGWHPAADEAFGDLRHARLADKFIEVKGVRHYYMRYQLWFGSIECYRPMSPETLAKRNASREANKAAKELALDRAAMPLLAEQIT